MKSVSNPLTIIALFEVPAEYAKIRIERTIAQDDRNKTQRSESWYRGGTNGHDGRGLATGERARSIGEPERHALRECRWAVWGGRGEEPGWETAEKAAETNFTLEALKLGSGGLYPRSCHGEIACCCQNHQGQIPCLLLLPKSA